MFTSAIAESIANASLDGCDYVARDIWKAWHAGVIDDPAVAELSTAIEARRAALRGRAHEKAARPSKPLHARPTRFPPRKVQVSPDRARSRKRRRTLAASGPMPPQLAARFTQGELAVLAIVAGEVREHGVCDRSYAELAARAGCHRNTARNAILNAAHHRFLSIERRPRPGRKNLTNLVRIVSQEWRAWLAHRIGDKKQDPTGTGSRKKGADDTLKRRGKPEEGLFGYGYSHRSRVEGVDHHPERSQRLKRRVP